MAFNGSGTFNRVYNWSNDKTNGINITASRFDTEDSGFATGLSNCICKDGQQTTTASIPFAQGINVAAGTVSSPKIVITGDLTTGFYQASAGAINFASEGVLTATFNANGLDNTVIGAGTPLAGSFTNLSASGTLGGVLANFLTASSTATLTNKTFDTAGTGNVLKFNGVQVTLPVIDKVAIQKFTTSGTYTPTTGMVFCIVEMVAGGGGGGGVSASNIGSQSGASGAYIRALLTSSQISTSQTVTIGSAGSAGSSSGTSGGTGGTTSLGSLLSCTGGTGGAGNTTSGTIYIAPVAGGTATVTTGTAILTLNGQYSGNASGQGTIGFYVGAGGSNPMGQGAAAWLNLTSFTSGVNSPTGYGGGGGGGYATSGSSQAGSAGGAGYMVITEFISA